MARKKQSPVTNGTNTPTPVTNTIDPSTLRAAGLPVPDEMPTFNHAQVEEIKDLVFNLTTLRADFLKQLADPRRSVNDECGYPETNALTVQHFKDLYDRFGIAARVVNCLPDESWMVSPEVYETEDPEDITPFEKAWDNLAKDLRGGSLFQDELGSPVWEYLHRADSLSRIGFYGVIFMGFDDGGNLDEPVPGAPPDGDPKNVEGVHQVTDTPSHGHAKKIVTGGNGTELQYGPQGWAQPDAGRGEPKATKKGKLKLLYIRVYDQSLLQIVQYENDHANRRYGQPIMYNVTMTDPSLQQGGIGVDYATRRVHWSRIVHLCDTGTPVASEVFAPPCMRPVYNHLIDLVKVYGAGAEGYWKSCFTGLSFETHPQLGGDVKVNKASLRDTVEQYQNGLQRYLLLMGMTAKSIAPQVIDPTPFIDTLIQAICILIGIPVRIFMGSERGELASSQDDSTWNDRLAFRQNGYLTPRVIVPFIDRLIMVGVLPEPGSGRQKTKPPADDNPIANASTETDPNSPDIADKPDKPSDTADEEEAGYSVKWPDLNALTDAEKATIFLQRMQAFSAYIAGDVQSTLPPQEMLTHEAGYTDEEAKAIMDAAQEHLETAFPEADSVTPGHIPEPPPEPGAPISMGPGQHLVSPDGSKVLQKTPHKPFPPKAPTKNESTDNAFCATGEGGGIDPTCSPHAGKTLPQIQDEYYQVNKQLKEAKRALMEAAGPRRHIKMDTATKKTTIGAVMEYQEHDIKSALRSPKVPREVKDAYRKIADYAQSLSDAADALGS